MLLNRKMEVALENLYKQGKVVGGVYFGLGQEACSCASAYALDKDDWFAPMIRNQGSLLVRGFAARDTMMQYMAKADSPTRGRDGTSHFGDIEKRNMVSPISMLGDLIPVLSGVALGARLQGRNVAVMTYIGDGGQSTGVTYEGINFAAVQNLGLVLFIESNLWAYSTPSEMQYRCKDLAERAIGYGIPGSNRRRHRRLPGLRRRPRSRRTRPPRRRPHPDRSQNDAHERPRHPRRRRVRAEANVRLLEKARPDRAIRELSGERKKVAERERECGIDLRSRAGHRRGTRNRRELPDAHAESAEGGVFCEDGCHEIKPKYGMPKVKKGTGGYKATEAAVHLR